MPEGYLFTRDLTRGERIKRIGDGALLPCRTLSVRLDPLAEVREQKSTPDPFRERGYSAFVQYALAPTFVMGVNGRVTVADADRMFLQTLSTTRLATSFFARLRLARAFAIAGEIGAQHNSRRELGYGAALQLDLTLLEGLRLLGTAGLVKLGARDEGTSVGPASADLQPGGWVTLDWLVNQRFETRLDAIKRDDSGTSLLARFTTYF
ncbi:MAG TPA: hypothetical protein VFX59_05535 [Polyangiales bacterium]|nr:hypothetical protein [Polyangiales bacterium]